MFDVRESLSLSTLYSVSHRAGMILSEPERETGRRPPVITLADKQMISKRQSHRKH